MAVIFIRTMLWQIWLHCTPEYRYVLWLVSTDALLLLSTNCTVTNEYRRTGTQEYRFVLQRKQNFTPTSHLITNLLIVNSEDFVLTWKNLYSQWEITKIHTSLCFWWSRRCIYICILMSIWFYYYIKRTYGTLV